MSRIGKYPVKVPKDVEITISGQKVSAKGKLGTLVVDVHEDVTVAVQESEDGKVIALAPRVKTAMAGRIWPTMRTLVNNIVVGVKDGYKKKLAITGVGYRANLQGKILVMTMGFSHEIRYPVPEGITLKVENQTEIEISGIDKQLVGQVAANIRGYKPPEPYKGKGIRYSDERIFRKEGKKK
jgi:large subunit ribosomal protein L6